MNDYVYGGGAVCVDAGATAEVYRTIFVDNACTGKGGAIKLKGMYSSLTSIYSYPS
jgi:hypothetical protein